MSLIRYTHPMMHLQQQINQMFEHFDSDLFGRLEGLGDGVFAPPVDVKEDSDAYTVHLEVPGVSHENLHLSLQDNVLTIRGSKEQTQQNEGRYRRIERSYGSFARSVSLPRNVDANGVSANLEDGVLEVRLPKREESKPRQINVGTTQNAVMPNAIAETATAQGPADSSTRTDTQTDSGANKKHRTDKTSGGKPNGAKSSDAQSGNEQAAGGNSEEAPAGNPS